MFTGILGNPFGHMTCIFPLSILRRNGIAVGNRLHPNLSNKGDKPHRKAQDIPMNP